MSNYSQWLQKIKDWYTAGAGSGTESAYRFLRDRFSGDPSGYAEAYAINFLKDTNAYRYLSPAMIRHIKRAMGKIMNQEMLQSMGAHGMITQDNPGVPHGEYMYNFFQPGAGFISASVGQQLLDSVIDKVGEWYAKWRTDPKGIQDSHLRTMMEAFGDNPEELLSGLIDVATGGLGGMYNRHVRASRMNKLKEWDLDMGEDQLPVEEFLNRWFRSSLNEDIKVNELEAAERWNAKKKSFDEFNSSTNK